MDQIISKAISYIIAFVMGVSFADVSASQTDLDYIFGPLEVVADIEDEYTEPEPYVYIEIADPTGVIYIGEEVVLRCVVVGMDKQDYTIQWQYSDDFDSEQYFDIDCHETEYRFIATHENVGYYYRVHIITEQQE